MSEWALKTQAQLFASRAVETLLLKQPIYEKFQNY